MGGPRMARPGRPRLSTGIDGRRMVLDYVTAHTPCRDSIRHIGRQLGISHVAVHLQLHRLKADGILKRRSDGSWEVA